MSRQFRPKKTKRAKEIARAIAPVTRESLSRALQCVLDIVPRPVKNIVVGYALPRIPIGKFCIHSSKSPVSGLYDELISSDKYLFILFDFCLKIFSLDGDFKLLKVVDDLINVSAMSVGNNYLFMIFDNNGTVIIDVTKPIDEWKFEHQFYLQHCSEVRSNGKVKKFWCYNIIPLVVDDTVFLLHSENVMSEDGPEDLQYQEMTQLRIVNENKIEVKSDKSNVTLPPIDKVQNCLLPFFYELKLPTRDLRVSWSRVHENLLIHTDRTGMKLHIWEIQKQGLPTLLRVIPFEHPISQFLVIDDRLLIIFENSCLLHVIEVWELKGPHFH
jgi:hypothetical protein